MQTFRSDADYNKTTLSKCLCLTSPREYIVQEDCPRVSILPGLDEGKSRSRSCQRTAQGAPQRLLLCGIVGRESLYRTTVMGTLTHTLGDPKPPDQGHGDSDTKHLEIY